MDELFDEVRESCSPGVWSRGVEIARADSVVGVSEGDDEIALQVTPPGDVVAVRVFLHPESVDWSCECGHAGDVCAHVAAAAIACRQARKAGRGLPGRQREIPGGAAPQVTATVAYRLAARGGRLALQRVLVDGTQERPLSVSLAAAVEGRAGQPVTASRGDFAVEAQVDRFGDGPIAAGAVGDMFEALRELPVTYANRPVRFGEPRPGVRLVVEDCAAGVRARLERDPEVDEVFENGALRVGDCLHAVARLGLGEREYSELRRGWIFPAARYADLVGELIPRWENSLPLEITAALPGRVRLPPRIAIETQRDGARLVLLPKVVYGDPPVARVDGESLTPLGRGDALPTRDVRRERRLLRVLEAASLPAGTRQSFAVEEAFAMLARWREKAELRDALRGGAADDFHLDGDLEAFMGDDAEVGFGLREGEGRADPAAVLRAWSAGESLVPLLDGGFARVPQAWLKEHGHRVRALLEARQAQPRGPLPGWTLADQAALSEALHAPVPPDWLRMRQALLAPSPPLPADLTATLRPYQQHGVSWLCALAEAGLGGLLADDMGLGKTLQALCALHTPALVVAPASVVFNWAREAARFRPSLKVCVYHGADRRLDPQADLTLTSYALLRLDLEQLNARAWATAILDEGQTIKNPSSQIAQSAYRLRARTRFVLTGTPVENRLDDLWSQLHFANPGLLGTSEEFARSYARPIGAGDAVAGARLRERVRPFVLRRLKREVAPELPARTEVNLWLDLAAEERAAYDTVLAAARDDITRQLRAGANTIALLEALLRLRQAAAHAALVPGQAGQAPRASAKIEALLEHLSDAIAAGHKAVVFSQWTGLLDLVEPHLRAAGWSFERLDGATRDRAEVVARFQAASGAPIFLVSLKAGGVGLNLTAADHVFLLDPWWNPAVEDQAADRVHRIGQTQPVMIYRLVARDTVEERLLLLQQRKRELAAAAVGEAPASFEVTREELLALIA